MSAPHTDGVPLLMASFLVLPLAAALWAQQPAPSSSHPPGHAKSSLPQPAPPQSGVRDGVYHNSTFGFSYKLPFEWVDRTADLQEASTAASGSRVLLAIFERPPEAIGDTVNSAVVIAAEPVPTGVKTAAEYFESLSALTTTKGFQVEEGPHAFSVGTTVLVRGEFSKEREKLTMRQASLVKLQKGFAISFTFVGGSQDEVNELIEKLSFVQPKPAR